MTKEEFLDRFKKIVQITEIMGGGYPLCFAIEGHLPMSSRFHFQNNMKQKWWPSKNTINAELLDGYGIGFVVDSILLARLICLCEWKEIVLKTKAYKEF